MGIKGDFGALASFQEKLGELGSEGVARIGADVAPKLAGLQAASIASGLDAYGTSHPALNGKWAGRRARARAQVTASGRTISTTLTGEAAYHHGIIPDDARGIPSEWQAAIDESARKVLGEAGAKPSGGA